MLLKHYLLAVLCMLPTLVFAHAENISERVSEINGPFYSEIITETVLTDLPCEFSWASVELSDGSTVNYMEEKDCQDYQGPCATFSVVKVLEARLNISSGNSCRHLNFSIPWLDYAVYYVDDFDDYFNEGNGAPESICGNFPRECENLGGANDACHCIKDIVRTQAIDQGLCFSIEERTPDDEEMPDEGGGEDPSCEERWIIETHPMEYDQIYANNVGYIQPTNLDALKEQIITEGPLVAIIYVDVNIDLNARRIWNYRDYTREPYLAYHSFVITGWEDQPNGEIVLHLDDQWAGDNGSFCGPGSSNPLNPAFILEDIGSGTLKLLKIGKVYTSSGCEGDADVFVQEDQGYCPDDDDPNSGGVIDLDDDTDTGEPVMCLALSSPTITNLYTTSSRKCLTAGAMNRVYASVNCGINGANNLELEWSVTPGGISSPSVNGCNGQAFIVPSSNSPVSIVRARARFGANCPWSDWYQEEFCVERKGDPDGPKLWGGE
jgi:hypothetical protein